MLACFVLSVLLVAWLASLAPEGDKAKAGAAAFMVLDGVWLGLLMKHFYRDQLAPIVRLADGGIARACRLDAVQCRRHRQIGLAQLQWL